MSSPIRILTAGLLAVAFGVLAVPVGLNAGPALLGTPTSAESAAAQVPAAQKQPSALEGLQDIAALDPSAAQPEQKALAAALDGSLDAGGEGDFTAAVLDAATGRQLYGRGADQPRAPASNLKLLTATSALQALGAETRFTTRVLQGASPTQVVLVSGGDVLLGSGDSRPGQTMGHAGLATLAGQTVASLQKAGTRGPVTVVLDDSLFSGPSLNPAWDPGDVAAGEVAPVFPLALNSARYAADDTGAPRPQDAAASAAAEFAAKLDETGRAAGISVASAVARGSAGPGAEVLARQESATVAEQVAWMLQNSDNYLAEVLGRMAAIRRGEPGSFTGAVATARRTAEALGIPTDGMVFSDNCGLALSDRISAAQLAALVRAMTSGSGTELRAGLAGFPVAGLSGTLDSRYEDPVTLGGAGLVRAKTGTLNTVLSLSGYVVDADGRLLIFSFVGNGLAPGSKAAKASLDRSATVLAGCGCR